MPMPSDYQIVDAIIKEQFDQEESVYNVTVTMLNVDQESDEQREVIGALTDYIQKNIKVDAASYETLTAKPEIPNEFKTIEEDEVTGYTPFDPIAFTGDYTGLKNGPEIPEIGKIYNTIENVEDPNAEPERVLVGYESFHNVAFSGKYDDLKNKPNIPDEGKNFERINPDDLEAEPEYEFIGYKDFHPIAFTGITAEDIGDALEDSTILEQNYEDLKVKPEIPEDFQTVVNDKITGYTAFDPIAFTGDYTDLKNGPEIPEAGMEFTTEEIEGETINTFSGYKAFENIAFTGDYGDLKNKPGIPEAGRNDITEEIEGEQVVTRTTYNNFHNIAFTGNYEDLSLKPAIPDEGKIFTRTNPDDLEAEPEYELTGYEDFNPIAFTGITADILDKGEVSAAIKQSAINFIDLKNLVFDTTTPSVAYQHLGELGNPNIEFDYIYPTTDVYINSISDDNKLESIIYNKFIEAALSPSPTYSSNIIITKYGTYTVNNIRNFKTYNASTENLAIFSLSPISNSNFYINTSNLVDIYGIDNGAIIDEVLANNVQTNLDIDSVSSSNVTLVYDMAHHVIYYYNTKNNYNLDLTNYNVKLNYKETQQESGLKIYNYLYNEFSENEKDSASTNNQSLLSKKVVSTNFYFTDINNTYQYTDDINTFITNNTDMPFTDEALQKQQIASLENNFKKLVQKYNNHISCFITAYLNNQKFKIPINSIFMKKATSINDIVTLNNITITSKPFLITNLDLSSVSDYSSELAALTATNNNALSFKQLYMIVDFEHHVLYSFLKDV